ncbi:MAG TPA: histidine phosphatase family protein [Micromonosporaceae bacterium]
MTRLLLWRHGRTEWNATNRVQGQADVDLDGLGQIQAELSAPFLAARKPILIVASDLRRAVRTAAVLAELTGLEVEQDERLRERDYGPWQGLTRDEIRQRYPDDFQRWGTAVPIANPAIESLDDLAKRMVAVLRDVADRVGDATAVLVTHGGSARVGTAALLGWPVESWHTLSVLSNCHVCEVRQDERGWQLRAHNVAADLG